MYVYFFTAYYMPFQKNIGFYGLTQTKMWKIGLECQKMGKNGPFFRTTAIESEILKANVSQWWPKPPKMAYVHILYGVSFNTNPLV